ncbi:MAG: TetR/AcrR family transcriptional regulator [Pseudomonadales bacterium]|jgi:TetR/AcrR family transcriptional repressor of lmrAB and yxaGH operons|nr:TetR/AcrR family transcriptional regulator [Pseudomonadales bacterium]
MPRPARHRERLVHTAIRLFRQKGYAATGLAEILEKSGAPKGSLYHHFPGGKLDVAAEAVRVAGAVVTATLEELLARTPDGAAFVTAYAELLAQWVSASEFRDGCPIATTLLETTPQATELARSGTAVFEDWCRVIGAAFERDGVDAAEARAHAELVVAAVEGALLLARVRRSVEPIGRVALRLRHPA